MTNPTINVNLSSLEPGTVPTVTESVEVNEGAQLDVTVTWPSDGVNTITVDLNFSDSGDQDPFNDDPGGDTNFSLSRNPPSLSATQSLAVKSDATITNDVYDLILTINGENYSTDPTIIIDPD